MKEYRLLIIFLSCFVASIGAAENIVFSSAGPSINEFRLLEKTIVSKKSRLNQSDNKIILSLREDSSNAFLNPYLHLILNGQSQTYSNAYKNGDIYFLIGDLDNDWRRDEWGKFYGISKWLVKHYFRVIVNPTAYQADLKEAVQNPTTSGILWSSHASKDGKVYGADGKPISQDSFSQNASPTFRHLVLSNCNGEEVLDYYPTPPNLKYHYWPDEANTEDFFFYLKSDKWNRDLENDLGIKL